MANVSGVSMESVVSVGQMTHRCLSIWSTLLKKAQNIGLTYRFIDLSIQHDEEEET